MNDEIQPTPWPIPEPPEDMPTKEKIEARNALLRHDWLLYGVRFTKKDGTRIDPNDVTSSDPR